MIKQGINKVLNIISSMRLNAPSVQEKQYLQNLRAIAQRTSVFHSDDCAPSEKEWFDNMNQLRQLVLEDNPRKFLQWDVVRKTMFISFANYTSAELKFLKSLPNWIDLWKKAIKESPVGSPASYIFYPSSSANLIHHAYHLSIYEERTGLNIDEIDYVMEFGGGYGSMCRTFHNLGFHGKYIIFDLPLFSALQKYYLSSIGVDVLTIEQFTTSESGVLCVSDLHELSSAIGNDELKGESLFVATWSLSEAPIKLRESIYPLASKYRSWLIAYQNSFGEVDNISFFDQLRSRDINYKWKNWPIDHMPGHRYLIGQKI